MAQAQALRMICFNLAFIHRKTNIGILGFLSNPKNFTHQPAQPLARSPQVKNNADKDPDNGLPDERTHAGIDICQNMHLSNCKGKHYEKEGKNAKICKITT
jgi:hypothetical protein